MLLNFQKKFYTFKLPKSIITSQGRLQERKGWLLQIQDSDSRIGWGEVSPFDESELSDCRTILQELNASIDRSLLEIKMSTWPNCLNFGIGAALAEIDGLVGNYSHQPWLTKAKTAYLLPSNDSLIPFLDSIIIKNENNPSDITIKWKVAIHPEEIERYLFKEISKRLPNNSRLRLDANGGWNFQQATSWVDLLKDEPKLEWLEQPLGSKDLDGLTQLSKRLPIALDESLLDNPSLINTWKDWQVRRPILEGDPRKLLKELTDGKTQITISTSFETGIGMRWNYHLAAIQQKSSTPTAAGLAPSWHQIGDLFNNNPEIVWRAV